MRSLPFPVFGFLDEIKEKWAFFAIHELEFFGDKKLDPRQISITPARNRY